MATDRETAFGFTEATVERVLRIVRDGAVTVGPDGRRWWRDSGSRHGLHLRASSKGGAFYRVHKAKGKKVKVWIGDATAMRVTKAREIALKMAGGDESARPQSIRIRTDGPTVEQAWKAYKADCEAGTFIMAQRPITPDTLRSYEELYRPHIRPAYGSRSLHALARDLPAIHRNMRDRPAAANRLLVVLKNLFTHAARAGKWAGPNPAIDPITGRTLRCHTVRSRARFLSVAELQRFREAVAKECDPWPDFFPLLLLTGVRKGNLRRARWAEFDLEAQTPIWRIPITKNGDPLTIGLTATAAEVLRARLSRAPKKGTKPTSEWVFPRKGNPSLCIGDTREAWQRICEAAGLTEARMHDIRRTHGSQATINGATLQ
ncbi:MAG: tyrosine-type recombinase/integrase, partial [Planctomycetaceae bacterium]